MFSVRVHGDGWLDVGRMACHVELVEQTLHHDRFAAPSLSECNPSALNGVDCARSSTTVRQRGKFSSNFFVGRRRNIFNFRLASRLAIPAIGEVVAGTWDL